MKLKPFIVLLFIILPLSTYALPTITSFKWGTRDGSATPLVVTANTPNFSNPAIVPPPSVWATNVKYGVVLCAVGAGCYTPYFSGSVPYNKGDTWDVLGSRWNATYGSSLTVQNTFNVYSSQLPLYEVCMGVFGTTGTQSSDGARQPGSCIGGAVSPAQCSIDATANINYGPIDINTINGLTRTVPVEISCDQPVTINIKIVTSTVDLGNGVTSTQTVEGQTNPPPIAIPYNKTVNVGSTLSSVNPTAGPISGNAIFIVAPQ